MSTDPNRLLVVISARGTMTWAQFFEAVGVLSVRRSDIRWEDGGTASRSCLLQSVHALGHCDTYYEEGHTTIAIAPLSLCRLPRAGLPTAVLTGARRLQTRKSIEEAADLRGDGVRVSFARYPGPLGLLPDSIFVESESGHAMASFGDDLRIPYIDTPPSWSLVNWCGTLLQLEEKLDYRIPKSLNHPRYDFSTVTLDFNRTITDSLPRYTRYRNPTTGLPLHVFFRGELGAEVDLSWGRYLLLKSKGITVSAYDERRFRLCVPVKTPLPGIVARALCLCSGQPPIYLCSRSLVRGIDCADWLMFNGVPPQIALPALSKVGQSPQRVDIQ